MLEHLGGSTADRRDEVAGAAIELVRLLTAEGTTVAIAESLTGGMVSAAVTAVPGASVVLRGGVVPYATDLKGRLLGVDARLLAEVGAVHPDVACEMAEGVRAVLGADYGVSTTGVAGPDPQDGAAVGTVFVAVSGPSGTTVTSLVLTGGRQVIRRATVLAALRLTSQVARADALVEDRPPGGC